MSVLIFLLVLSFLVVIHELGHFIAARRVGITVEEFGIGYPPRALTLFTDKQGTVYTLNWLPFGGFVRVYGEDGPATAPEHQERAFYTKTILQRLSVVLAGAAINFLFGALAFSAVYSVIGIPANQGYISVSQVAPGSPAEAAQLKPEDKITALIIAGETVDVASSEDFIKEVTQHKGETIGVQLEGEQGVREVYIRKPEETPEGQGAVGVVISSGVEMRRYPWWQMPVRGMIVGIDTALRFGAMLLQALGGMVKDLVTSGNVPAEVAGPIGIGYQVQKNDLFKEGWLAVINFAAILSINLAIVNVLPLPALDGGRAAFLVVESFIGKRVNPSLERWANTVGFLFLLGLIMLISLRDIRTTLMDEAVQNWFRQLFS